MSSFFAIRALLFAGELLAGSVLIMTMAWLAASQRAASSRHLTWAGAFGVALALPVFVMLMPSPFRILLAIPRPDAMIPGMLNDAASAAFHAPPATHGFFLDTTNLAIALGVLWLFGACAIALRYAVGMLCLAALKRRSRLYALAPDNLPKVPTTGRECELRLSESEQGPVTWGIFAPVILLPKAALSWPRERLHAVLLHELAHIRRRDSFVQALSHLACAIYWPNPLIWLGEHRLRREAEMAADDAVIVSGRKPSTYAGELLRLATEFRSQRPGLSNIPLSMAAPSALEARVKSVLAPTSLRSAVTTMDVLKIAGVSVVSATVLAIACPSLAQDAPTPPFAPPAAIATPQLLVVPTPTPPPPAQTAPMAEIDVATTPAAPAVKPADSTEVAAPSADVRRDEREASRMRSAELRRERDVVARAAREARDAIARARPEMERAMAEARIGREHALRAAREALPEIERSAAQAGIDGTLRAIRDAQPEIDAAMDKAEKMRPEIDRAMAKVRAELAKEHLDADIKVRVDAALNRAEIRIKAAKERADSREERQKERQDDENNETDSSQDE
jgi:beta-lactamase regulating signal transducer with metallopeptidase domain